MLLFAESLPAQQPDSDEETTASDRNRSPPPESSTGGFKPLAAAERSATNPVSSGYEGAAAVARRVFPAPVPLGRSTTLFQGPLIGSTSCGLRAPPTTQACHTLNRPGLRRADRWILDGRFAGKPVGPKILQQARWGEPTTARNPARVLPRPPTHWTAERQPRGKVGVCKPFVRESIPTLPDIVRLPTTATS